MHGRAGFDLLRHRIPLADADGRAVEICASNRSDRSRKG